MEVNCGGVGVGEDHKEELTRATQLLTEKMETKVSYAQSEA